MDAGNNTVGCGPGFKGHFFFYSYFLIMNQILLKLFIAIICSTYDDLKKRMKLPANSDDLELYQNEWANYDNKATGYIRISDLEPLLASLGRSTLGIPEHPSKTHRGR